MLDNYTESLPYEIQGWEVGDDDFVLSIRVRGCWFKVQVSPACFINSPSALRLFNEVFEKIVAGEDFDVWDYSEDIAILFIPHFQRLAPPKTVHTGTLTLADLASPGSFECDYKVIDEKPTAVGVQPRSPETPPEAWQLQSLQPPFPIVGTQDVVVPYEEGDPIYDIVPQQVLVKGRSCYYKPCEWPYDAVDELKKHVKIQASGLAPQDLRVSRLIGIIGTQKGYINGFLYDWIEQLDADGKLASIITSDTPASLREKWVVQIRDTVTKLHQMDVIWGDVKADNIIIDKNGDAVVVGLEGGATEGWIDRDLADTADGDNQGLDKLIEFINNDESPLRLNQYVDEDDLDDDMMNC